MIRKLLLFLMFFVFTHILLAQGTVKGVVLDDASGIPLQDVVISIFNTEISEVTNKEGAFSLQNIPFSKQILVFKKKGYQTQRYPLNITDSQINLGEISLYLEDTYEDQDLSTIVISDDELNDNTGGADNISGLLQSSRDVFLRTAAFEWSPSFFRVRGLDSDNAKVLINGVEMNKLSNRRPQWSNWGGLNDVLRNQEFSNGLIPSNYTFGGALGSTHIGTRASSYKSGGRISYASSNRSYVHRVMGTFASGVLKDGWSFVISGSRRAADEGFQQGTPYNAYSFFGAIEKKINEKHSLNFTSIYAFNKRGKAAPNSNEVYDIKGIKYNPYWGYQNGKIRNSRNKVVEEPIVMLSHYWNISPKVHLNTNIAYQFGKTGNSRLDYNGVRELSDGVFVGGGGNPDPTYYKKMPSYAISKGFNTAYHLLRTFQKDGQINWRAMYRANSYKGYSKYILYEDRNDEKQLTINSIMLANITDNIILNGKLKYTSFESDNFANVLDLLGGEYYLDVDSYGDTANAKQNNLQNPSRKVLPGDRFKYNYKINSNVINGFVQAQFNYNKIDFFAAANYSKFMAQRNGLYENGAYLGRASLGKSRKVSFNNYSAKVGATYKFTGRHLLAINGAYLTKAPALRNLFSRENNFIVDDLKSEEVVSADLSYIFRSPKFQAKFTGYYLGINDANDVGFFYSIENNSLTQVVTTNSSKSHFGTELGVDFKLTPTFKIKGASNIGQYTFNNNPNLFVITEKEGVFKTRSYLKNYKVPSGPQKTYSLGFEYRDPDFWWCSVSGNYFDGTYINISSLRRTTVFSLDNQGIPFKDYQPDVARKLLEQERLPAYFILNAVGGKSWKLASNNYVGFFASISNAFNKRYKTGGYEFSRYSNYKNLKEESVLETPVFGNKYWFGRGATYFLNVYYRF